MGVLNGGIEIDGGNKRRGYYLVDKLLLVYMICSMDTSDSYSMTARSDIECFESCCSRYRCYGVWVNMGFSFINISVVPMRLMEGIRLTMDD